LSFIRSLTAGFTGGGIEKTPPLKTAYKIGATLRRPVQALLGVFAYLLHW